MKINSHNNIIGCIFFTSALFILVWHRYIITPEGYSLRIDKMESYEGVIKRKYINRKNHNDRTIILNHGSIIVLPPVAYYLFDSVQVGDYIYKEQGTLEAFVILNDSTKLRIPYTLSE